MKKSLLQTIVFFLLSAAVYLALCFLPGAQTHIQHMAPIKLVLSVAIAGATALLVRFLTCGESEESRD